jgi:2-polyprenyl-6-methoxyphenol hydroxylase-like FAD-dependent oxidoreductase
MTTVLISGAGIAGPSLALWLSRYGFHPTVVEIAPALRVGGNAVDFRGDVHLPVLAKMGVLEDLRRVQTGGTPMRFVDREGRVRMALPADFAGGELEVLRGDLATVLHEHTRDTAEYVFGDSVADLVEGPHGVDVTFASGTRRRFDLVIGADGVHSTVRRLVFGPEQRHVRHLGYHVATWDVPNHLGLGRDTLLYNEPGRMVSIGGDHRDPARATAFVAFASPPIEHDRHDRGAQEGILREVFSGMGWQAPRLLAGLRDADELYFDAICRVDVEPWARGRIALLGDAAWGATIGGMGNGTAVVGAYVLAGELAAAAGDHSRAFARYQQVLRDFARRCQSSGNGTGRFLAPRRAAAIWLRNTWFNQHFAMDMMLRGARDRTEAIDLPDYATSCPPARGCGDPIGA